MVADERVADEGVKDEGVADEGVKDEGVADEGVKDEGVAEVGDEELEEEDDDNDSDSIEEEFPTDEDHLQFMKFVDDHIHNQIYVVPRPPDFVHQHLAPSVGIDTKSYVGSLSFFHLTTVRSYHTPP
ncbi:hypothetical protein DVH24_040940 [Malus domestica]|uniref:Uncharacterized protein n=1 Tax=Malus domestica TaxID=3750 RepID=A0A498IEY6_MALDO|nr:hypothetical protein DVH24_040940 [Malus domestica]